MRSFSELINVINANKSNCSDDLIKLWYLLNTFYIICLSWLRTEVQFNYQICGHNNKKNFICLQSQVPASTTILGEDTNNLHTSLTQRLGNWICICFSFMKISLAFMSGSLEVHLNRTKYYNFSLLFSKENKETDIAESQCCAGLWHNQNSRKAYNSRVQ